MVLSLCRRVLGNAHDAEDAFQTTFLILARKATSVVKRDAVGSWLFAVAQRAAREARHVLARRRARERQVDEMPHPLVGPAEPEDWRPLLDREIARLPRKYQEAVVLVYLEGWPLREAAIRLGVPLGTLSYRLVKARRLLAKRLTRSGLSLSVSGLTAVLSEGTASFETLAKQWGRLDFVVHAIAYSDKDELKGRYVDTTRENFLRTMDISCFSFTDVARRATQLMPEGGSLLTLTYFGAERVMPHYNVMGVAKAGLEASVRYPCRRSGHAARPRERHLRRPGQNPGCVGDRRFPLYPQMERAELPVAPQHHHR